MIHQRARWLGLVLLVAACAPAPGVAPGPVATAAAGVHDPYTPPALPAGQPISAAEYAARRTALVASMEDGVLLVLGSEEPEADYLPFAQDFNFRYLTGVLEPGAALVISKRAGRVDERLFVLPRNPARETWEGARLGAEGARAATGIPSRTVAQLLPALDSLLAGGQRLYTLFDAEPEAGPLHGLTYARQVVANLRTRHPGLTVVNLAPAVQRLRAAKSPAEIDMIRRAVQITNLAHRAAMRTVQPGMNEFEIQALIEYTFRRHGAERPAFSSIVGSGPNSTTLHYRDADRFMQAGEVVVMDIGASYRGYAADVTRTIPVGGAFTPDQRAVYEIVLSAQKAAESLVRPGATWQQLNAAANGVITEGLARLGLIDSPSATYQCDVPNVGASCPQYRIFYMHGLGHGIGLAVHDPDVSYSGPMQERSAFSIEPGIYVRADALDFLPDTPENRQMIARLRPVVERYRNIGVRIEDDYVVTATGFDRLSDGAPREVAEIEALMRLPGIGTEDRRPQIVEWYRQTTRR